jgi:hypothetical protein
MMNIHVIKPEFLEWLHNGQLLKKGSAPWMSDSGVLSRTLCIYRNLVCCWKSSHNKLIYWSNNSLTASIHVPSAIQHIFTLICFLLQRPLPYAWEVYREFRCKLMCNIKHASLIQLESYTWACQQVQGHRWEDAITLNLKETEHEEGREVNLAYDRMQWCNLAKTFLLKKTPWP